MGRIDNAPEDIPSVHSCEAMKTCILFLTILGASHLHALDIQGKALGEDSHTPKAGVTVRLVARVGGGVVESKITDGSGSFKFSVSDGDYNLKYELRQHTVLKETEVLRLKSGSINAPPAVFFKAVPPDFRQVQAALNLRARSGANPVEQFQSDAAAAVAARLLTKSQAETMRPPP